MQLSKDKLLDAYTRMKKIRVFEETMRDEFAKGTVPAFIHLYIGQEAIATGICVELNDTDTISSTHRGHGHCIAKKSNLEKMTMEIFVELMVYVRVRVVLCILPISRLGCLEQMQ